ncbi:hypothetical protein CI610_01719 [invertebrate metagenome]|uniref:Uncharacterized protein n=1 Tax=invertebrate metagenome TaxID=1711999 RepID=A0A2H9T7V3_9ZZZZ
MSYAELDFRFVRDLLTALNEISPLTFYIESHHDKTIELHLAGTVVNVNDAESALISLMFAVRRYGLADDVKRFVNGYINRKGLRLSLVDISSLERLLSLPGDKTHQNNDEVDSSSWDLPKSRYVGNKNRRRNFRQKTSESANQQKMDYSDADRQLQQALRQLG